MIYYSVNCEFADYKYKIAHFLLYYKHFLAFLPLPHLPQIIWWKAQ